MSLINDALKKAQHVQALKGSGAPAGYHPAPSKDAAPAESISNVMPETTPSRGRMGTVLVAAVLGLVTLGGAGYMFFLRTDSEPVVVQRRPAVATPVAPAEPTSPVTPAEPAVVEETAPEITAVAATVEPVAPAPTTPDSFFQPSTTPTETEPVEAAIVESIPEPVKEPALVINVEPTPVAPAVEPAAVAEPVSSVEEESFAEVATSPAEPITTAAEPELAIAEIATPAAPEPAEIPAVVSPVAAMPEVAVEEPAVAEPEPTPAPAVAVAAPAVTEPAPQAQPAPVPAPAPEPVAVASVPPPEPVTVADPEIQLWVNSIKVAGLRMGPVPKVLMNDRVYAQGEMVQFDFELRLIEVTETLLKFKDPKGHIYFFRL